MSRPEPSVCMLSGSASAERPSSLKLPLSRPIAQLRGPSTPSVSLRFSGPTATYGTWPLSTVVRPARAAIPPTVVRSNLLFGSWTARGCSLLPRKSVPLHRACKAAAVNNRFQADFRLVKLSWAPLSFVDEAHRSFARAAAHALPPNSSLPTHLQQQYQSDQQRLYQLRQIHQKASRGAVPQQIQQQQQLQQQQHQQQQQQHNRENIRILRDLRTQQQQIEEHNDRLEQYIEQQQWLQQRAQQEQEEEEQQQQQEEQEQQDLLSPFQQQERRLEPQLRPASPSATAIPTNLFNQTPVLPGSADAAESPSLWEHDDPFWSRLSNTQRVGRDNNLVVYPTGSGSGSARNQVQPVECDTSGNGDQPVERHAPSPDPDYRRPTSRREARASAAPKPAPLPAPARTYLSRALKQDEERSAQSPSVKPLQAFAEAARKRWAKQAAENQPVGAFRLPFSSPIDQTG